MVTSLNMHSFLISPSPKFRVSRKNLDSRHQLFHIREVAFDKIRKFRQFAVLSFVSILHFLYLLAMLFLSLYGFLFKFLYAFLANLLSCSNSFNLPPPKREPTFATNAAFASVLAASSFSDFTSCLTSSSCYSACCCSVCNCRMLASSSPVCRIKSR